MLLDTTFDVLKRGLSYAVQRHDAITENLANVSTPLYRRKDIDFRQILSDNMDTEAPMEGMLTDSRHIPLNIGESGKFAISHPDETDTKNDGNNVDLDKEVVNMSNNSVYYESMASILNKKFRMLTAAISEKVV